ncbi:Bax inhibitor-1/YccA family protein, partial [Streptomyces sp. NPDC004976]
MRSRNPVFSRRGFSRDNGYAGFNAAPQAGG